MAASVALLPVALWICAFHHVPKLHAVSPSSLRVTWGWRVYVVCLVCVCVLSTGNSTGNLILQLGIPGVVLLP